MARESQGSFLGLPPSTLIALVMSAAGFFAFNKLSFEDTRPPDPPAAAYWHASTQLQDVEARLWEDPMSAIAAVRSSDPVKMDAQHSIKRLQSAMRGGPGTRIVVIEIPVSGESYAEDIERRRRTRYAVLAGLHRAGFTSENSDHVGYFPLPATNSVVAYEWMKPEDANTDSSYAASRYFVVLLWIDEEGFRNQPLTQLSGLIDQIDPGMQCAGAGPGPTGCSPVVDTAGLPDVSRVIMGPSSSDGLRAMVQDLMFSSDGTCRKSPLQIHRLMVYSYSATASDESVLHSVGSCKGHSPSQRLEDRFTDLSQDRVQLFRTLADDGAVTGQLIRRHIEPAREHRHCL